MSESETVGPKSVKIEFTSNNQVSLDNEYENFELRDKVTDKINSKTIMIYTPYMIMNKTNIPLIIGTEKKRKHGECVKVMPNSSEFLRVEEGENKL
jgi:hypothetical protein